MPPKDPQFPPGNDELIEKGPCDACGSTDANARYADGHIGHERNQQAEDPEQSLITRLRALKNRPRSRTGEMIRLKYNLGTGRLLPTEEPFPTKGKGREKGGGSPPASDDY